jgi:hypothetical protein
MERLLQGIIKDDRARVQALLGSNGYLAIHSIDQARLCDSGIFHWLYVGDTALHLAAAGYRDVIVQMLLNAGADPNASKNHRRSAPLHYAADGYVSGPAWNPELQVETIRLLIKSGADVHAADMNGATALHRAVRTRCAAAVKYLIDAGSDPGRPNRSGSTPFHLAVQNTGHGGSGSSIAKAGQQQIIEEFLARGLNPKTLMDAKGKSVLDSAKTGWIRNLLCRG